MKPSILSVNNYHYPRGGADIYHLAMIKLLEERGHRVHVLSTADARNVATNAPSAFARPGDIQNPGLADIVNFVYSSRSATVLRRLLSRASPDIAHLHVYYGFLTSAVLEVIKEAGLPAVQTLHDYKIVCPVYTLYSGGAICQKCNGHAFWHCAWLRCNRGSLSRSVLSAVESYVSRALGSVDKIDHFIAISDFVRSKMIELGLPAEKITTIHNFTEVSTIEPGVTPGSYFLFFGRLERVKGVMTLLEAAAPLKETPLLIAGQGDAAGEMRKFLAEKELHHVHLLGFQQPRDLGELIRNSICTVVPSEWCEPFGLTVIESLAHGRPVIASGIGGLTEIVSDGEDGFLVPPGDVHALRERLWWMSGHRKRSAEMGISGRRKVEARFSPEVHYERLSNLYKRLA